MRMKYSVRICSICIVCIAHILSAAQIRVATFNCSLNRKTPDGLVMELSEKDSEQAANVARLIRKVNPDILLLNEFDYDENHRAIDLFRENYLADQGGQSSPQYKFCYTAPVNTGVPSGFDLDNDGKTDGAGDGYGYGKFPGQYGMVILSKYPIVTEKVRTFQTFLWKDMPDANLPDNPATDAPADWYSEEELAVFRLSSKSHWDVPVDINGAAVHVLVSHPTPPVFDGPEDRNGKRNHDEIRFWADYITPEKSGYIYDDKKKFGGLKEDALFVIMGDQNADPFDGDTFDNAIDRLLKHPSITDTLPLSKGAEEASKIQAGVNLNHKSDPKYDTYQSSPGKTPGNLRLDYILVSKRMKVTAANVYWPGTNEAANEADNSEILKCSDHRMVYVDLKVAKQSD